MHTPLEFSVEVVNGDRLGSLTIPLAQVATWLNFLASPHYGIQLLTAEQGTSCIRISFQASEGVYGYLHDRIRREQSCLRIDDRNPSLALVS